MNQSTLQKLILSFFCIAFTIISFAQQKTVDYSGQENLEIIYGQLSYIPAGDSVSTLAQAEKLHRAGQFSINSKKYVNLGIAKDNYWVSISIQNTEAKVYDLILNLENPRLNEVDIYILRERSEYAYYKVGDNFNFLRRPVHFNQFAIPVSLRASERVEILMLLKHKGNTLQLPISLHSRNSFYKKVETNYLIVGVTTGIFLLTFFFSIFLYLKSFNRLFIFYAIYLISILLWLFSTEGYGFQYLWPDQPEWATRFGPGFSVFNLTTFILVALEFTKPYDNSTGIRRTLYGIALFTLLWGLQAFMPYIDIRSTKLMSVFLNTSFTVYIVSLFIMMAYLLYVSIKKSRLVFYYFFAVIVSIVFSLLVVARHSGWIDFPISSGSFASIGVIFEIILMTMGIASQFNQYKKEKEEMLIQYIDQQKSITQQIIETQEQERKRISREMHDDIGAGLTQIVLISESIRKKVGNANEKEISDIAATSRKLVNNMSEIIWSMNPENKTLGQLLSYLREELNKQLEYAGLNFALDLQEPEREVIMSNVQLRNIVLVTKEIINNSIKHSNAKNIEIRMMKKENRLIGHIVDDGCGFDLQQKSAGNGLKNIRQRIEELGGELFIQSKPGQGSDFEFIIPLSSTT